MGLYRQSADPDSALSVDGDYLRAECTAGDSTEFDTLFSAGGYVIAPQCDDGARLATWGKSTIVGVDECRRHWLDGAPLPCPNIAQWRDALSAPVLAGADRYVTSCVASVEVDLPRDISVADTLVVLDTNVFVAAGFNPASASARLLAAVRHGQLRMVWNEVTRREIEYIVRKIPRLDWAQFTDLFRTADAFAGPTDPAHFAYISDPDDRKFIALAAAAGATLVTNDAHLLQERAHAPTPILTPGEFLIKIRQG